MGKKIMTVKTAGSLTPPIGIASRVMALDKLDDNAPNKIWKRLIIRFKRVPTRTELKEKKDVIKRYYEKGRDQYILSQKKHNATFKVVTNIEWTKMNPLKYYVLIVMTLKGQPGDTSFTPPKAPGPPKGVL